MLAIRYADKSLMWYSFVLCGSVMLSQLEYATFETYINQRAATLHNIVDQFAYYANKAQPDRVCLPLDEDDSNVGTPGRLRIYGEASGSDAELVGVSYNAAGRWGGLNRDKHERRLEALASIAEDAGVPGIWIGETNGKFGVGSDEKEVGEVNRNSSIKCSPSNVEVDDLAQEIRDSFASDATPPSKPQDYTTEAIDGFQDWAQGALGLVTIDIDVLGLNEKGEFTHWSKSNVPDSI
jgi:hypothetical protein